MIRTKRVYEPAEPEDGYRVLVDRLWPRGVSKDKARLDAWAHEFPSAWSQLVSANGADERTCTLQLSKAHFLGFLDFEWQPRTTERLRLTPSRLTSHGTLAS